MGTRSLHCKTGRIRHLAVLQPEAAKRIQDAAATLRDADEHATMDRFRRCY